MKQLRMKIMLLFGLALLLSATDSFAQGRGNSNNKNDNPGRGNNGNNDNPGRIKDTKDKKGKDGRGVPLDGGATLLLAAGAAYGLKRLKDNRNTEA